ncbi:MAG: hypothetical protein JSR54_05605 [Proteobacteria bacterium]|nr:hypothetical protein [Pseudomonadota bacterium]
MRHPRCTREDARTAAIAARPPAVRLADAIATEALRPLPAAPAAPVADLAPAAGGWTPARFADHLDYATRLRAVRRFKLVPVYDNAYVTVFLGLDRHGVPGLHLQPQAGGDLGALLWNR